MRWHQHWIRRVVAVSSCMVCLGATVYQTRAFAYAEDACPVLSSGWINCSTNLCPDPESEFIVCETIGMLTTVVSQAVRNPTPGGRRSMVHFDATYYLAQAAGLTPRDAYIVAAYAEAPDLGSYVHRGRDGAIVIDPADCTGEAPDPLCMLNTPVLGGLDRNNFTGGGTFYHFQAPLEGSVIEDGLHPDVDDADALLFVHHVRRWLYGEGPLCVGGLTDQSAQGNYASGQHCFVSESREPSILLGRIPFVTELGFLGFADWVSEIHEQAIVTDPYTGELTPASTMEAYIDPEDVPLARLGIYLHALGDSISHHRCNDDSILHGPRAADAGVILVNPLVGTLYQVIVAMNPDYLVQFITDPTLFVDPDFFYEFSTRECDQLSHANRHTWETGTSQANLEPTNQTTEAGLQATLDELQRFAEFYLVPDTGALNAQQNQTLLADLLTSLETQDAAQRIDAVTVVGQKYALLPLPGYGGLSAEDWLQQAGDAYFASRSGGGQVDADVGGDAGVSASGSMETSGLLLLFALAAWRKLRGLRRMLSIVGGVAIVSMPAQAYDFSLGPVDGSARVSLSTGASWRAEDRSNRFIGKTNVEGQQELCAQDDCLSFTGDPAPNQRLVDAEGAYFGTNADNGNLNYDQWDVTYATTRAVPKLILSWGEWRLKANALAYYDWANVDFDETHPNTLYQEPTSPRPQDYEDEFALGFKMREAFLSGLFTVGDHEFAVGIGNQLIRWGEANTLQFGTLSAINPLDATVIRMPGAELAELPIPVPAATLSTFLSDNLSVDLVWLSGWEPFVIDTPGSFMSTSDVVGGGEYAIVGLGQFSEDPNGEFSLAFPASLATSTSVTINVEDRQNEVQQGNEYGAKINYFADWLNNGTELGFYYLHYNSRLPLASAVANQDSCARDSGDIVTALAACRGGTGLLDGLVPGLGLEILPLDTQTIFLEYPEDLNLAGVSFNTNVGGWALAGELAYHFDLPLQVHIVDTVFAALQPAFPRQDLHIGVDTLTDLVTQVPLLGDTLGQVTGLIGDLTSGIVPGLTVPGAENAVPSFLDDYRGIDVQGGQTIHGYETRDMAQLTLSGLQVFRRNPIGANEILFLLEGAVMHIFDLPGLGELQFEGAGDDTHASPGADGTGSDGVPDARRVNPTQQTGGFATATSWGYRSLIRATYNQVFGEYTVRPTLLWFHDVGGISPVTYQNFIEGRMQAWFFVDVLLNQRLKVQAGYQAYFGAEKYNAIGDRDTVSVSLTLDL
jgi:hypothetical protein